MTMRIKLIAFGAEPEEIGVHRFRDLLERVAQCKESFEHAWSLAMQGPCVVNLHRFGAAIVTHEPESEETMADSHVVVRTGFAASNPRQQLYQVFRLRPDGAYYPVDDKQNDPVQFDKAFARRTQYMKEPEG